MATTAYELWTYRDAIEHVLDVCVGNDRSERNQRLARRAINECYREFPTLREWRYFQPRVNITTVANQTTGTIAYTHSTRQVTLTGATWPDDVLDYALIVNQQVRCIPTVRDSSTVITLSEIQNPGADIASGTSYELYKDTYALPDTFVRATGRLQDVLEPQRMVHELTVAELVACNRLMATGIPQSYTFIKHPRYTGGMAVIFAPAPTSARTYELPAITRPRPLVTETYSAGTVAVTSSSTTVTGTSTTFVAAHAGCVLRISSDAQSLPTSVLGSLENVHNPAAMTRMIKSFSSTTSLTLEQAADQTLSGKKYTIGDPIDLEHGAMLNAFLRMTEFRFDLLSSRKEQLSIRRSTYERALEDAAIADQRGSIPDVSDAEYAGLASIASSVEYHP